jgi:site-specific recombinase XerD
MSKGTSSEQKPKVSQKRLHLRPDEARALIAAAGKRSRYRFRDRVPVQLVYSRGLRANEAVSMRWDH